MATTFGLTDQGLVVPMLDDIRSDLIAAFQAAFGASIDTSDSSVIGQIIGILAERLSLLWEQLEAVYSSQDPNSATGAALDAISAITGTVRPAAEPSIVTLTLFGVPATVVPTASGVQTASTGAQFNTNVSATIATVPNWVPSTAYLVGDRVFNDTVRIYQCTAAGASASSGGPTGTGTVITDGTATWSMIGNNLASNGAVDVSATSVNTGRITASAGDLTVIANQVFGWNAVTNLLDATLGRDLALDSELRGLRQQELSGDGKSPLDAIEAALLKITNIISATVFQNNTNVVDGNGMLPNSVEALVRAQWAAGDPLDQQIFDALFQNVAAGIQTVNSGSGAQTGTSVDSQGTVWTVKYSRPAETAIYVVLNVTVDAANFPADGAAQIQSQITNWGQGLSTGRDAVAAAISAKAFLVAGVLDVPTCYIGTSPSPVTSTTIAIPTRGLATYASTNITVNVTPGTP